jgi:hypothetical protein
MNKVHPRVPPSVLSQPVHLLAGLRSLPFPPPSAGSELCSIVSHGGGDVGVVVRDTVLRVGPLLGLDPLLERDDLAGEALDASLRFGLPNFLLLDGDSVGRKGFLPTKVLRNPNPNSPSLTPSLCSISAILVLTIFVLF